MNSIKVNSGLVTFDEKSQQVESLLSDILDLFFEQMAIVRELSSTQKIQDQVSNLITSMKIESTTRVCLENNPRQKWVFYKNG